MLTDRNPARQANRCPKPASLILADELGFWLLQLARDGQETTRARSGMRTSLFFQTYRRPPPPPPWGAEPWCFVTEEKAPYGKPLHEDLDIDCRPLRIAVFLLSARPVSLGQRRPFYG